MGSTANTACGIPQFKGGPDFQHWSFRVKMHLDSVGVLANLTENAPDQAAAKTKFEEADRKAKALIVSFLANECLEVIREKTTAKQMWTALEATFATRSIGTQHLIRKQLNRLKLKEGDPVRPHLLVFDDLIRQMKTAGARVDEADQVILLFQTLPDSFDPLVTALENIPEKDLTVEVAKQRLLAEDMKRMERSEECGESKLAAFWGEKIKKPFKFQGKCHRCGKRGHLKKDCLESEGEANSASQRKAVSFVANRGDSKRTSGKLTFKLDSGSSDHLVNDKDVLSKLCNLKQPIVVNVAKDGESLIARKVGEINGESNKKVPLSMKEVLYVPELRDNLMSVKKLTTAGVDVSFSGAIAVLKKGVETIATAHLRGGLYELEVDVGVRTANLCKSETDELRHQRLGHLGQQGMQATVRDGMETGAELWRTQLDPRSREAVMAGYAPNDDRLWNRNSNRISSARGVKSDETYFPYEKNPESKKNGSLMVLFSPEQEGEKERNADVQAPDDNEAPITDDDVFLVETDEIDQTDEDNETGALPSHPEQLETEGQAMLRLSERERKLPGKFLNFFIVISATSAGSCFTDVPACFNDIAARNYRDKWNQAMKKELASLETNRVWEFERCPSNVKPLRPKWVFRIKEDEDGQAARYRACLVVKWYLQRPGVDFEITDCGEITSSWGSSYPMTKILRFCCCRKKPAGLQELLEYQRVDSSKLLVGFADADAKDTQDHKSISECTFTVFGAMVPWSDKKKTTIAMPSSKTEYVALSAAEAETIWLSELLEGEGGGFQEISNHRESAKSPDSMNCDATLD